MRRSVLGFISMLMLASGCASSDPTPAETAPPESDASVEPVGQAQEPVSSEWCWAAFRAALEGCRNEIITPPKLKAICVIAVHAALQGCLANADQELAVTLEDEIANAEWTVQFMRTEVDWHLKRTKEDLHLGFALPHLVPFFRLALQHADGLLAGCRELAAAPGVSADDAARIGTKLSRLTLQVTEMMARVMVIMEVVGEAKERDGGVGPAGAPTA